MLVDIGCVGDLFFGAFEGSKVTKSAVADRARRRYYGVCFWGLWAVWGTSRVGIGGFRGGEMSVSSGLCGLFWMWEERKGLHREGSGFVV